MKWWDFSNIDFLVMLSILVVVILSITIFIITFFYTKRETNTIKTSISEQNSLTRVYTVDMKNNSVTCFSKSDMKNKIHMDLNDFYRSFYQDDTDKIKNWLFNICVDPAKAEQYIEADVTLSKRRNVYFSLLKLIKYDPKVGLIHLESSILKYITPHSDRHKKHKKGVATGSVKRSVVANMVNKSRSPIGYTFAIRFFYIRQKALFNERVEKYMVMTLKNEIYPFAINNRIQRQILEVNENEIMLFDLHLENNESAMRLATSIARNLNKCLTVNGFSESLNYSIGIVPNGDFFQDFDTIFLRSEQACIAAQQKGTNIYLTQRSENQILELNKYQNDVEHLFDKDALRYLFRPIVETSNRRIVGYFQYVRAYSSPFANLSEMIKYASHSNQDKKLFSKVFRTVIPKFANEKPNNDSKLFITVSMVSLTYLDEVLSSIPSTKQFKLVLVFDEQEVNENSQHIDLLNIQMEELKNKGYSLALLVNDKNLLLDPMIYTNFDLFIAGANTLGEIKKNNRTRLTMHVLIERLLRYKKPIIATDLESWQSIELIMKSGIDYISSEAISSSNDMLLPIERKKKEKIATLANKYQ